MLTTTTIEPFKTGKQSKRRWTKFTSRVLNNTFKANQHTWNARGIINRELAFLMKIVVKLETQLSDANITHTLPQKVIANIFTSIHKIPQNNC